jgi:hypothetical protein
MIESYRIAESAFYLELILLDGEPFAEVFEGHEDGKFYGFIFPSVEAEYTMVQGDTVADVKAILLNPKQ